MKNTEPEVVQTHEEQRLKQRVDLKREIEKGLIDFDGGRIPEFKLETFLAEMNTRHATKLER